jgi:PAS domain S-box-containing protein
MKPTTPACAPRKPLAQSQGLLQAILDHSPAYIYVRDLEGRFLASNRLFNERFAVDGQPMAGKWPQELLAHEGADRFGRQDAAVLLRGVPVKEEQTHLEADGAHTYLTLSFPVHDAAGEINAVCGVATDITAHKLAEFRLRELAGLLDQASDAILVVDLNHRVSYWNRSAERLFGWVAGEAVGRCSEEVVAALPLDRIVPILREHGAWTGEISLRNRAGAACELAVRASLSRDPAGQPSGFTLVCAAVSEKAQGSGSPLRAEPRSGVGLAAECNPQSGAPWASHGI